MAEAKYHSEIMQCREDSNKFVERCFRDAETGDFFKQEWFHREIQDAIMDESRSDEVIMLPRSHGKSSQLEAAAIWLLGNNPNLRIKIVCESDGRAMERLSSISQHITTNERVQEVFPHLRPARREKWTQHKIIIQRDRIMRDASIEALGVLSGATGGRADVLLPDDAVGFRNAIVHPKLRETVKMKWDADWCNLLEPNGRTFWFCTPWHVSDCTHMLLANPSYNVVKIPVGTEHDPFEPLWEYRWPRERLQARKRKIGEMEYNRAFRLVALSGEYACVQEKWISYWEEPPDVARLRIFVAFDVSSGEARDYFACVVLGVDPSAFQIYVLDAWHAMLTFLGRAEAVEREARRWQPDVLGIEQENMKSLQQYLQETTLLNIVPLRPTLPKQVRLMGITPYLERGQVLFNPALRPESIANREEHGDLVTELTEFPLGANDDLVDAFVHDMSLATAYGVTDDLVGEVGVDVSVIGGAIVEPTLARLFDT